MSIIIEVDNPHHFLIPTQTQFEKWLMLVMTYLGKSSVEVNMYIAQAVEIEELNALHRNKPKPTNILSFPFERPPGLPENIHQNFIGDLVICPDIIKKEALAQKKITESHWAHIFIHGILHLYGYDHIEEQQACIMEAIEIKLLTGLGYADPYKPEGV